MRKILGLFAVLLISVYACRLAVCDDRVNETYTLKLNGIPLRSDVAEGILLRINDDYKRKGIKAYDNVQNKDILLTEMEKNMDITIGGNELLSNLSNLYENILDKERTYCRGNKDEICIQDKAKKMDIHINKNDRVVSYLTVR
ncbi:MAG: hypothetical protein LBD98_00875 [Endomicrobium sp.]|jgi:hypothetical protein|nr:hypothetical protein [Endomicrobium sp.]